jgi:hypothetical protein
MAATDHVYSMNALDHLFWAMGALCVVRVLDKPKLSGWMLLGLVLGLGLLNKVSVLWFGAGLAASLLMTTAGRAALRTPGPYVAAAIAGLIFSPHVLWQIRYHWPTAEFAANAMAVKYVRLSTIAFLRESTMIMSPAALPLTIAGMVAPFLSRGRTAARPLAIIFVATAAIIMSSKSGKTEYLDAAYPLVFASGAVAWEAFLANKNRWLRRGLLGGYAVLMLAAFAIPLPLALPVLTEPSYIAYAKRIGIAPMTTENKKLAELPQHYADMHGWNELVGAAAQAWNTLTPDERRSAKIWAVSGGYGSAAAIDVLGSARGLPRAISTHNNYWLWGYGVDDNAPVILLGGRREWLEEMFASVEQVTTVECGYCMPFENHKPVYVGRGQRQSFAALWPELKHFE